MSKKIMILGAGYLQVPGILKAKNMGYEVVALDMNPNAEGFKHADNSYCISTLDKEEVLNVALKEEIDGIMTLASDMPVRTVAYVSQKMGFKFMSEKEAEAATNKLYMRQKCQEFDIPGPKFFAVSTIEEYKKVISNFNGKYITKPVDNSGGRGIYLVDSKEKAESAFYYSQKFSRSGLILIEEYMEGKEVSVESITIDGKTHILAITDKLTTGAPYFVEIGHAIPAPLQADLIEKIHKVTVDTINCLGIKNGPSHTEIKITEEGPKLVEIGARLGGGNITSHLVPLATGIDITDLCIKLALNEDIEIKESKQNGAALRYVEFEEGQLVDIEGIELAYQVEGVKKVTILKQKQDMLKELKSCDDRVAYVIASGENVKDAICKCEQATNLIKLKIKK